MRTTYLVAATTAAWICFVASADSSEPAMFRVDDGAQAWIGTPVAGANGSRALLLRDGRLAPLASSARMKELGPFAAYTVNEMRGQLQKEFGRGFEVVSTGPYLIVQPQGLDRKWADRFDRLYRSFKVFFRVRGLETREPRFPLVAVVLPTHQELAAYAQQSGDQGVSSDMLGYYSPSTNRIVVFDQDSRLGGGAWSQNEAVIIHEASHQVAFNVGLHSRFALPPRWLVEGMGCLFEAPGVWNSTLYSQQVHRINDGRLRDFRHFLADRPEGLLPTMIADESLFQAHPQLAYSEAWAFSFFLLEQEPKKLLKYLKITASRTPRREYSAEDRVREFVQVFGNDWRLLEARYLRFMQTLNIQE